MDSRYGRVHPALFTLNFVQLFQLFRDLHVCTGVLVLTRIACTECAYVPVKPGVPTEVAIDLDSLELEGVRLLQVQARQAALRPAGAPAFLPTPGHPAVGAARASEAVLVGRQVPRLRVGQHLPGPARASQIVGAQGAATLRTGAAGGAEAFTQTTLATRVDPMWLQEAEGAWAQAESAEAQVEDLEEDARLGAENAQLREENARLAMEEAQLRRDGDRLRQQDAELRKEDEHLRGEDIMLRHALTAASSSATWAHRNASWTTQSPTAAAHSHRLPVGVAVGSSAAILAFMTYLVCCTDCFETGDDPETDSDSDDIFTVVPGRGARSQEQRLRDMIDGGGSSRRCCCCSAGIAYFCVGVVTVSVSAGWVLAEMGLLQDVLSNFFMYTYVVFFLAGFISLLLWEVWRVLRRLVKYVLDQLQSFNGAFRNFGIRAKYKCNDLLDDGMLNQSFPTEDPQAEGGQAAEGGMEGFRRFTFDWATDHPPQARAKRQFKRAFGGH